METITSAFRYSDSLQLWTQLYSAGYIKNKYSVCIEDNNGKFYITTNLRVLVENNWLKDLHYLCEPTEYHQRRITVCFVCDRGVSHELVRHNLFCVA